MPSQEDLINQLQLQLAQPPQPSIFGVQAPPDPQGLRALLQKLQQQQAVAQTGNTPGEYGYLHDAGQKGFAALGQQLGSAVGGALQGGPQAAPTPQGAPYTVAPPARPSSGADMDASGNPAQNLAVAPPTPNQGNTPSQSVTNKLQAAQAYEQSLIQNGAPADQARVQALTQLVKWGGVQGASDKLLEAQKELLANSHVAGETTHNLSQSDAEQANIAHQSFEQGGQTWHFVSEKDGVQLYKNANGDPKVVTTQPSKTLPAAPLSPAQDAAMDNAVDMVGSNRIGVSDALSRMSGPQRFDFLSRLGAKYPDYNTPGFKAKTAIVQAYTSGTQGQAAIKMENAANHSDMVDQAGQALDNGDLPTLNRIANALGVQTGKMTTPVAVYNAILPVYAAEVNSSLVKGGGGEAEREARVKALSSDLPQDARHAALMGIQGMLRAQAGNMAQTYSKVSGRNDFYDLYPGLRPAGAASSAKSPGQAAPSGNQAPATTGAPPPGWTLQQDAKGNKAYVSPDGKNFQEVR